MSVGPFSAKWRVQYIELLRLRVILARRNWKITFAQMFFGVLVCVVLLCLQKTADVFLSNSKPYPPSSPIPPIRKCHTLPHTLRPSRSGDGSELGCVTLAYAPAGVPHIERLMRRIADDAGLEFGYDVITVPRVQEFPFDGSLDTWVNMTAAYADEKWNGTLDSCGLFPCSDILKGECIPCAIAADNYTIAHYNLNYPNATTNTLWFPFSYFSVPQPSGRDEFSDLYDDEPSAPNLSIVLSANLSQTVRPYYYESGMSSVLKSIQETILRENFHTILQNRLAEEQLARSAEKPSWTVSANSSASDAIPVEASDFDVFYAQSNAPFEFVADIAMKGYPSSPPRISGVDIFSSVGAQWCLLIPLITFFQVLAAITSEKEEHQRHNMKLMGMRMSAYWCSWVTYIFFYAFVSSIVLIFAGMACQFPMFLHANFVALFIVFFSFFVAMQALAVMISVFINNTKTAQQVGFAFSVVAFLWVAITGAAYGGLLSLLYSTQIQPWVGRVRDTLGLFPPLQYAYAFFDIVDKAGVIVDFSSQTVIQGPGFSFGDLFHPVTKTFFNYLCHQPSPIYHVAMMWVDALLLFFVGLYLDVLKSHGSVSPIHPLFCLGFRYRKRKDTFIATRPRVSSLLTSTGSATHSSTNAAASTENPDLLTAAKRGVMEEYLLASDPTLTTNVAIRVLNLKVVYRKGLSSLLFLLTGKSWAEVWKGIKFYLTCGFRRSTAHYHPTGYVPYGVASAGGTSEESGSGAGHSVEEEEGNLDRSKRDDVVAIRDLSFVVETGTIVALLGHNGAGKTTAINVITGELDPTAGTVDIGRKDLETGEIRIVQNTDEDDAVKQVKEEGISLGICPQHDILWPTLTATETLRLYAAFKGIGVDEVRTNRRSQEGSQENYGRSKKARAFAVTQEIERVLRQVNLFSAALFRRPVAAYSGGMKRRLSFALAALGNPSVILADEPTTGMDPVARASVVDVIHHLRSDSKSGILLTTHIFADVVTLADKVLIMSAGRLIAAGTVVQLTQLLGDKHRLSLSLYDDSDETLQAVMTEVLKLCPKAELILRDQTEVVLMVQSEVDTKVPLLLDWCEQESKQFLIEQERTALHTDPNMVSNTAPYSPETPGNYRGNTMDAEAEDNHDEDQESGRAPRPGTALEAPPSPRLLLVKEFSISATSLEDTFIALSAPTFALAQQALAVSEVSLADENASGSADRYEDAYMLEEADSSTTAPMKLESPLSPAELRLQQVKALIVKNFRTLTRQRGLFICQIITPLFILALLALLQSIIRSEIGASVSAVVPAVIFPLGSQHFPLIVDTNQHEPFVASETPNISPYSENYRRYLWESELSWANMDPVATTKKWDKKQKKDVAKHAVTRSFFVRDDEMEGHGIDGKPSGTSSDQLPFISRVYDYLDKHELTALDLIAGLFVGTTVFSEDQPMGNAPTNPYVDPLEVVLDKSMEYWDRMTSFWSAGALESTREGSTASPSRQTTATSSLLSSSPASSLEGLYDSAVGATSWIPPTNCIVFFHVSVDPKPLRLLHTTSAITSFLDAQAKAMGGQSSFHMGNSSAFETIFLRSDALFDILGEFPLFHANGSSPEIRPGKATPGKGLLGIMGRGTLLDEEEEDEDDVEMQFSRKVPSKSAEWLLNQEVYSPVPSLHRGANWCRLPNMTAINSPYFVTKKYTDDLADHFRGDFYGDGRTYVSDAIDDELMSLIKIMDQTSIALLKARPMCNYHRSHLTHSDTGSYNYRSEGDQPNPIEPQGPIHCAANILPDGVITLHDVQIDALQRLLDESISLSSEEMGEKLAGSENDIELVGFRATLQVNNLANKHYHRDNGVTRTTASFKSVVMIDMGRLSLLNYLFSSFGAQYGLLPKVLDTPYQSASASEGPSPRSQIEVDLPAKDGSSNAFRAAANANDLLSLPTLVSLSGMPEVVFTDPSQVVELLGVVIYPLVLTIPLPLFLSGQVLEKEAKLVQQQLVSGVRHMYLHLITYGMNFVFFGLISTVFSLVVSKVLHFTIFIELYTPYLVLIFIGYGLALCSNSTFLSAFLWNRTMSTTIGFAIGLMGPLLSVGISAVIFGKDLPWSLDIEMPTVLTWVPVIGPTIGLTRLLYLASYYCVIRRECTTDYPATLYPGLETTRIIISLFLYAVVIFFFALWLDQVLPRKDGIRKPLLFFLPQRWQRSIHSVFHVPSAGEKLKSKRGGFLDDMPAETLEEQNKDMFTSVYYYLNSWRDYVGLSLLQAAEAYAKGEDSSVLSHRVYLIQYILPVLRKFLLLKERGESLGNQSMEQEMRPSANTSQVQRQWYNRPVELADTPLTPGEVERFVKQQYPLILQHIRMVFPKQLSYGTTIKVLFRNICKKERSQRSRHKVKPSDDALPLVSHDYERDSYSLADPSRGSSAGVTDTRNIQTVSSPLSSAPRSSESQASPAFPPTETSAAPNTGPQLYTEEPYRVFRIHSNVDHEFVGARVNAYGAYEWTRSLPVTTPSELFATSASGIADPASNAPFVVDEEQKVFARLGQAQEGNGAASNSHSLNSNTKGVLNKSARVPEEAGAKIAISDLSIAIPGGTCFGVLGQNGAGKSTLLHIIQGALQATNGCGYVSGYDITNESDSVRLLLGVCPQIDAQWPTLTVLEHVLFYARVKGVPHNEELSHAESLIKRVGLYPFRNRFARDLSGGMKRRLSIACALVGYAKLIMLDEPSTGLDPASKRALWKIIAQERVLGSHSGRVILLVTHDMSEVEVLTTSSLLMVHGRIRAIGTTSQLRQRYGTGYSLRVSFSGQYRPPSNAANTSHGRSQGGSDTSMSTSIDGSRNIQSPSSQDIHVWDKTVEFVRKHIPTARVQHIYSTRRPLQAFDYERGTVHMKKILGANEDNLDSDGTLVQESGFVLFTFDRSVSNAESSGMELSVSKVFAFMTSPESAGEGYIDNWSMDQDGLEGVFTRIVSYYKGVDELTSTV